MFQSGTGLHILLADLTKIRLQSVLASQFSTLLVVTSIPLLSYLSNPFYTTVKVSPLLAMLFLNRKHCTIHCNLHRLYYRKMYCTSLCKGLENYFHPHWEKPLDRHFVKLNSNNVQGIICDYIMLHQKGKLYTHFAGSYFYWVHYVGTDWLVRKVAQGCAGQ